MANRRIIEIKLDKPEIVVALPEGSVVRNLYLINLFYGEPSYCMGVEVDPDRPTKDWIFRLFKIGEAIPDNYRYVLSFFETTPLYLYLKQKVN